MSSTQVAGPSVVEIIEGIMSDSDNPKQYWWLSLEKLREVCIVFPESLREHPEAYYGYWEWLAKRANRQLRNGEANMLADKIYEACTNAGSMASEYGSHKLDTECDSSVRVRRLTGRLMDIFTDATVRRFD